MWDIKGLDNPETCVIKQGPTEREKHQAKKEAFLKRLQYIQPKFSKSHNRRLKRKVKEQIIGSLTDMHAAIAALGDCSTGSQDPVEGAGEAPPTFRPKQGMIGQGRKVPLSRSQRKRVLEVEQLRQPLILSNPDFSSNPFKALRTHAGNTLLKYHTLTLDVNHFPVAPDT